MREGFIYRNVGECVSQKPVATNRPFPKSRGRKNPTSGRSKNFERGRKTIYQPNPHLSQIHTM